MSPKFEIAYPSAEEEPTSIEVVQRDLLAAHKYNTYLLNALNTRTTKEVKRTPEYLAVLKKAKSIADEVNRLQEQIEALLDIAKKHEG